VDTIGLITQEHRREILRLVWDAEKSAGELAAAFDVTFGAVSQHLARLREADLVRVRVDGNRRFYRANQARLSAFAPMLTAMWNTMLGDLAERAESSGE
jgi:DNA-binding transcriptional ArsR family regulator